MTLVTLGGFLALFWAVFLNTETKLARLIARKITPAQIIPAIAAPGKSSSEKEWKH